MLNSTNLDFHHQLLDLAEAVKPLSATVVRLASVVADEQSTLEDIEGVLRQDPSLVAALLRESNSALSASATEIKTVEAAVVRLGVARVLAIGTSAAMADSEAQQALESYGLEPGDLWHHAQITSYVAEAMYRMSPRTLGPEVVTASLLHDIGQLVLNKVLDPIHFKQALAYNQRVTAAERELAEVDHAELGALLLELWQIPAAIVDAVRFHHEPELSSGPLADVVYVANEVAHHLKTAEVAMAAHDGIVVDPTSYDEALADTVRASTDRLGFELDVILSKAVALLQRQGFLTNGGEEP